MTTAIAKIPARPRGTLFSAAKRFADELHRTAERRVAYQYDQPWKADQSILRDKSRVGFS